MAFIVDGSVGDAAEEGADLQLRVRGMGDSDAQLFLEALVARLWDVRSVAEPEEAALAYASSVLRFPGGAAVVLDCHEMTEDQLGQIPDLALAVARELGISEGTLVADPPTEISAEAPASVLWMRPFPFARPVAAAAMAWVTDLLGGEVQWSVVLGLQPVDARQAGSGPILELVDGLVGQDETVSMWLEADGRRAGVGLSMDLTVSVALERASSGDRDSAERDSSALRAFAESLASDLRWAAIDPDGSMEAVEWIYISRPPDDRYVDSPLVVRYETACVPDAFWWQLLTPQHLEGLDEEQRRAADPNGALQLGAISDWVGRGGPSQRAHARDLLAPIFMQSGTRTGPFDETAPWT